MTAEEFGSTDIDSAISETFVHVTGAHCTSGEFAADMELSERTESLELEALLLIDSSEELDFKFSSLSRSSSLKHQNQHFQRNT